MSQIDSAGYIERSFEEIVIGPTPEESYIQWHLEDRGENCPPYSIDYKRLSEGEELKTIDYFLEGQLRQFRDLDALCAMNNIARKNSYNAAFRLGLVHYTNNRKIERVFRDDHRDFPEGVSRIGIFATAVSTAEYFIDLAAVFRREGIEVPVVFGMVGTNYPLEQEAFTKAGLKVHTFTNLPAIHSHPAFQQFPPDLVTWAQDAYQDRARGLPYRPNPSVPR